MAMIPVTLSGPADGMNCEHEWAGENLEAYLLSDVGKKREHNEDSCVLCVPDDPALRKERGMLFAVADGMGGASAGERASHLALETIIGVYYTGATEPIPLKLREALEAANLAVFEEASDNPDRHGMGTTVSAMVIREDHAYIAQVGDSRVYVRRDKFGLLQITRDHSLVAEQVRNGFISEREAQSHSLKNLITRAVGIKNNVKIDLFAFPIQQGDTFLLCSDGLSNLVGNDEIVSIMKMEKLQGVGRILVGRALDEGGGDNITALLVRVKGTSFSGPIDAGAEMVAFPKWNPFRWIRERIADWYRPHPEE